MKTLQKLIPNLIVTDKQGIDGEAIEYHKQFQLQVQVTSLSYTVVHAFIFVSGFSMFCLKFVYSNPL
ncbi:hypothetical protein QJS04_geneDACA009518 [Acorus gramineus]|uniref:Uncharacterized protein n=1 Tax=Acorus gramineus TaxID=55184 RepID=A0AAV9AHA1_ACOGR|nr:hypothetical protein QJS04_geneDACA009518 [Acorus gramineus]